MANALTLIQTRDEPFVIPPKTVVWDISSPQNLLKDDMSMSREVDFNWPESLFRKGSFSSQSICLHSHPWNEKLQICVSPDAEKECIVKWSVKVWTSKQARGQPLQQSGQSMLGKKQNITIARIDFKEVSQLSRTKRLRIEVEFGVLCVWNDSELTMTANGPTLSETIGAGLIAEDFLSLSDVTVVANDGVEYSAHRLILSLRSPVLRAAFHHDMKESQTGRLQIDASSAVVDQLLKFMYTDGIQDLTRYQHCEEKEATLLELYELSFRYELLRLQSLLEIELVRTLSIANVSRRLLLSVLHNSSALKHACTQMVKNSISEVMETEEWAHIKDNPMIQMALSSVGIFGKNSSIISRKKKKRRRA